MECLLECIVSLSLGRLNVRTGPLNLWRFCRVKIVQVIQAPIKVAFFIAAKLAGFTPVLAQNHMPTQEG